VKQRIPRRSFLLCCAASLAPKSSTLTAASAANFANWKQYRIDATITALGAAIFSRKHVGEAFARLAVEETKGGRKMNFTFMGASLPERTRGILQMGHFEEQLEEVGERLADSNYFGFLTAAPPDKGLQTVPVNAQGQQEKPNCCAVDGSLDGSRFRFRKTYEAHIPADATLQHLPRLRAAMRQTLDRACAAKCLLGDSKPSAQRTFLKTLVDAVESKQQQWETDYHYGDKLLQFRGRKAAPVAGLASMEAQVQGRGRHRFAFYYRPEAPLALPEKIEYWPRTWLRLTLLPMEVQRALPQEQPEILSKNSQSKEST
jgi:hypothetical protein